MRPPAILFLLLSLIPAAAIVAVANTGRIAPGFSCPRPAPVDALSQLICDNTEMSREQATLEQTYYALRWATGRPGWKALKMEAAMFDARLRSTCGMPQPGAADQRLPRDAAACYAGQTDKAREIWLQRLTGAAHQEAVRPIEQQLALQRQLVDLGLLPQGMAVDGIYGAETRTAIMTWQRLERRPQTNGFLSDADAASLSSTRRRPPGATVHGSPPGSTIGPATRSRATGHDDNVTVLATLFITALLVGVVVPRRQWAGARRRNKALGLAFAEIAVQQHRLQIRKTQLIETDVYGTIKAAKWIREKDYFCRMRIMPLLTGAGLADQWALICKDVDRRLERAASASRPTGRAPGRFVSDPLVFDIRMDPIDYERHCALLLRSSGWTAQVTVARGDQGTDVLASRHGKTLVLQCKLYRQPVGNSAVQEISAARLHQRADFAAVVSNARYTPSARQLARTNRVYLLHHEELDRFDPATTSPSMPVTAV